MRMLLIIGLAAFCGVFMSADSLVAGGHRGHGKAHRIKCKFTPDAQFIFINVDEDTTNDDGSVTPASTIAVLVRARGSALPTTLEELLAQATVVDPDSTGETDLLKCGKYEILIYDMSQLVPAPPVVDDPLVASLATEEVPENVLEGLIDRQRFQLDGENCTLEVSKNGIVKIEVVDEVPEEEVPEEEAPEEEVPTAT